MHIQMQTSRFRNLKKILSLIVYNLNCKFKEKSSVIDFKRYGNLSRIILCIEVMESGSVKKNTKNIYVFTCPKINTYR